ncbi:MAG: hypothetical protein NW226_01560 [Microscillaceae bacterium]|nr:hypothetical protein [Microscillaceae bacterium]
MELDLHEIRLLYSEAAKDDLKGQRLYKLLEKDQTKLSPTFTAYWGAALAMQAKNTLNVFSKLYYIQKANEHFAKAVKLEPENVEIRFLRFSIQLNTPAFLGYSQHIDLDKTQIMKHLESDSVDLEMRLAIADFLLKSGKCTAKETDYLKLFISAKL